MSTWGARRNTKQRAVILEELRKLTSHPTASDLYEIVKQKLPSISMGTVYRNLLVLSEMGEVQTLEGSGGPARFDGNATPHYHVQCVHCGRMDDVHDAPDNLVRQDIKMLSGYEVVSCPTDFQGVCPKCQAMLTDETAR